MNCRLDQWLGNKIPLELHHINGKHRDNTLSNLQLLCPNCHALTDNYCGKDRGIKNKKPKGKVTYKPSYIQSNKCIDCNNSCTYSAIRCRSCASIDRMNNIRRRPSKEQLIDDLLNIKVLTRIGRKYNVSDNAVRKWIKYYKLSGDSEI